MIENLKGKIDRGNESCIATLENLLDRIVSPGDEFDVGSADDPLLKVDEFKKIFSILSKEKAGLLMNQSYDSVSNIDVKVMSSLFKAIAYYILDEQECFVLMKQAKKNLHIDNLTKDNTNIRAVVYSLSVYVSLYTHFKTDYNAELQEFVTQWIIGNFAENFSESQCSAEDKSFQLNVILQFLSTMTEELGMNKFNHIISYIPEDTLMASKQAKRRENRKLAEEAKKAREDERKA